MKRERVNYGRKLTSGSEADRNQGATRESLNGEIGKSKRPFTFQRDMAVHRDRLAVLARVVANASVSGSTVTRTIGVGGTSLYH
jgi:hypothetical protein